MPIQVSEIHSYCALSGLTTVQDRRELMILVQAMDQEFLEVMAEKKPKEDAT